LNSSFYYAPKSMDYYTQPNLISTGTTTKTIIEAGIAWTNMNEEKKEEENMKTLYRIFVVTNKGRIIVRGDLVIAINKEEAAFNINLHPILRAQCLKLSEVTVLFEELGKVKVEDEDDEG